MKNNWLTRFLGSTLLLAMMGCTTMPTPIADRIEESLEQQSSVSEEAKESTQDSEITITQLANEYIANTETKDIMDLTQLSYKEIIGPLSHIVPTLTPEEAMSVSNAIGIMLPGMEGISENVELIPLSEDYSPQDLAGSYAENLIEITKEAIKNFEDEISRVITAGRYFADTELQLAAIFLKYLHTTNSYGRAIAYNNGYGAIKYTMITEGGIRTTYDADGNIIDTKGGYSMMLTYGTGYQQEEDIIAGYKEIPDEIAEFIDYLNYTNSVRAQLAPLMNSYENSGM